LTVSAAKLVKHVQHGATAHAGAVTDTQTVHRHDWVLRVAAWSAPQASLICSVDASAGNS
jgi:hypothetical protein